MTSTLSNKNNNSKNIAKKPRYEVKTVVPFKKPFGNLNHHTKKPQLKQNIISTLLTIFSSFEYKVHLKCFKLLTTGNEEMAQPLKTLTALPEDQGSNPSTHVAAHNCL